MWWGEGGGHHLQALAAGGQEAGHGHAGSQCGDCAGQTDHACSSAAGDVICVV